MEKSNSTVMPPSKFTKLLENVEALPALKESNRVLREANEKLEAEVASLNAKVVEADKAVEPLKLQLREATDREEKLQVEVESLKGDSQRWRQRSNQLIEKSQVTYNNFEASCHKPMGTTEK